MKKEQKTESKHDDGWKGKLNVGGSEGWVKSVEKSRHCHRDFTSSFFYP